MFRTSIVGMVFISGFGAFAHAVPESQQRSNELKRMTLSPVQVPGATFEIEPIVVVAADNDPLHIVALKMSVVNRSDHLQTDRPIVKNPGCRVSICYPIIYHKAPLKRLLFDDRVRDRRYYEPFGRSRIDGLKRSLD